MRAALGVLVCAPGVSANQADAKRIQRAEERDDDDRRRIARHIDLADDTHHRRHQSDRQRGCDAEQSTERQEADGQIRKGENAVEQIVQLLAEGPGAFAVSAFAACVADFTAPKSEPKNQADERRASLVELQKLVSDRAVAAEQVDAAFWDVGHDKAAVQRPEDVG